MFKHSHLSNNELYQGCVSVWAVVHCISNDANVEKIFCQNTFASQKLLVPREKFSKSQEFCILFFVVGVFFNLVKN